MNYQDCASQLSPSSLDNAFEEVAYHTPVMPEEVVSFLKPHPGKILLDGTLGGGGHTRLLLRKGATVVALDQDADAISEVESHLTSEEGKSLREHLHIKHHNFRNADHALDELGITQIHGALLDLGVSSHQLDEATRGFSFQQDGPLDMRMDRRAHITAADLVNSADFEELLRIFRDYGEQHRASRVASRIIQAREKNPIQSTEELTKIVESVIPRKGPRQPATQIFQAIRIAVNDELQALEEGLKKITQRLAPGAPFVVISFHSLEDRIVKHFFKARSQKWLDRPEWPEPRPNPDCCFELLTRSPMVAGPDEIRKNPRARSAKLRVARKIN
ncbi:MAG: 16S rRNA (cytosine(1402)-N(4))-methyltransferase RsmH [Chthoniobacterales bacterium]